MTLEEALGGRSGNLFFMTLSLLACNVSLPAEAVETRWVADSGEWSVEGNWDPRLPRADDLAVVDNDGVVVFNTREASVAGLRLGMTTGGSGSVRQEGGRHHVEELNVATADSSDGRYSLLGGELSGGAAMVGAFGVGTMTNRGALHLLDRVLTLGGQESGVGRYVLQEDGALFVNTVTIGNEGAGTMLLKEGRLWGSPQGDPGHRVVIGKDGGVGSLEVEKGGDVRFRFLDVGEGSRGSFKQVGGAVRVESVLGLGHLKGVKGSYTLADGSLESGRAVVGEFGIGDFEQTGGSHQADELIVGKEPASDGTYGFTEGSLSLGDLTVGGKGRGRLEIESAEVAINVSNLLRLGSRGRLSAPPGTKIRFSGVAFENHNQGEGDLGGLSHVTLHVTNPANLVTLEASGRDRLGALRIGDDEPSEARLVDEVDNNQSGEFGDEVFEVGQLLLEGDSILDLNGFGMRVQMPVALSEGRIVLFGGRLEAGGRLTWTNEASVLGGGTMAGDITNGGELALTEAARPLSIEGDYTQTGSGELSFHLAPDMEAERFPLMDVAGDAALDGDLTVTLAEDWEPEVGEHFPLVHAEQITGEWASITTPLLPEKRALRLLVGDKEVVLAPVEAGPPHILTEIKDQAVFSGETARFHVLAVGKPEPTFQWLLDGNPIPDATDRSLTIPEATASDAGRYEVVVRNTHGSVRSGPARLQVTSEMAPAIRRPPESKQAHVNDRVTFSVEAEGAPSPTYQWLHNGSPIPEETAPVLTLAAVTPQDAGEYRARIENRNGNVVSAPASLVLHPYDTIVTVPVGTPGNADDTRASVDDSRHGAVEARFRIGRTEINNYQYASFLNAVAKWDYFDLFHESENENLDPYRGIVREGEPGSYSYTVKEGMGFKPVNFISFLDAIRFANWWHNGRPKGVQDTATTEAGAYLLTKQRKNQRGNWVAEISKRRDGALWFLASEDEWYKAAFYDPEKEGNGGYWRYATGRDVPPNPELPPGGTNSANYASLGDEPGEMVLTEVGRYFESESAFGTRDQNGNVSEWTEGARETTPGSRVIRGGNGGSSKRSLQASRRHHENWDTETLALGARLAQRSQLAPPEPPEIHLQPFDQKVFAGQDARFVVQATGVPRPQVQWHKEGEPIPGANQRRLILEDVGGDDVNNYSVTVSNPSGSATSRSVQLKLFSSDATYARWKAPTGGTWSVTSHWDQESLPKAEDKVVIDRPEGVLKIEVDGVHEIRSLYSNEPINLLGGELRVNGSLQVNHLFRMLGGSLVGARVEPGHLSGSVIHFENANEPVLRDVTMNAGMQVKPAFGHTSVAEVVIEEGLELNGSAQVDDNGKIIVDGTQAWTGNGEVELGPTGGDILVRNRSIWTIGESITIHGGKRHDAEAESKGRVGAKPEFGQGTNGMVLKGVIRSDVPEGRLRVAADRFSNEGLLAVGPESELALSGTWTNRSTITAASDSTLTLGRQFGEGIWRNDGVIQATGAVVRLGGVMRSGGSGEWRVDDSEVQIVGEIENEDEIFSLSGEANRWVLTNGIIHGGTIRSDDGAGLVAGARAFQDSNLLEDVTLAARLDMRSENAYVQGVGVLTVAAPIDMGPSAQMVLGREPLDIKADGRLRGRGRVEGTVSNGGLVDPGLPRGELTVEGDLRQQSTGVIRFELASAGHDRIAVGQTAELGGTLEVRLEDGFTPAEGTRFDMMRFSRRAGDFESYRLPLLEEGLTWRVASSADAVTLIVEKGNDADADGMYDQLERLYDLDPESGADAESDPDEDGASNRSELRAGTDPRDPESILEIRRVTVEEGALKIAVNAVPGRTYRLESVTRLDGATWEIVGEPRQATVRTAYFSVAADRGVSSRYFRVSVVK